MTDIREPQGRGSRDSQAGQKVFASLMKGILANRFEPGCRVPTRRELMSQFGTSSITVQRAFDRLIEAGFIEGCGRRGTFVVERPPHLYRVGLVFRSAPGLPEWRHFWSVVVKAAERIEAEGVWRFESYYSVRADHQEGDWQRLAHDVRTRRLAGIVFGVSPKSRFAALERLPIAKIAISEVCVPGSTTIRIDQSDFLRKAVAWLAGRGCRRVGLITVPGHADRYRRVLESLAKSSGLHVERRWMQLGLQDLPDWTRNLAEMMFQGEVGARPDGLIVSDDNLTASVCAGLQARKLLPGKDIHVASHANFPLLSETTAQGVQRIGYDDVQLLRDGLDCIMRKNEHGAVPEEIVVSARAEESRPGLGLGVETSALKQLRHRCPAIPQNVNNGEDGRRA